MFIDHPSSFVMRLRGISWAPTMCHPLLAAMARPWILFPSHMLRSREAEASQGVDGPRARAHLFWEVSWFPVGWYTGFSERAWA